MRSSKSRSRSKSNRQRSPMGNIVNRVFDSSGPEGKVRGTPQQIIDKYLALARDAQLGNDRVAAENFLQHAEHYARMLGEAQREQEAMRQFPGGDPHQRNDAHDDERRDDRRDGGRDERAEDRRVDRRDHGRDGGRDEPRERRGGGDVIDLGGDDESGLVDTPEARARDERRAEAPAPVQPKPDAPAAGSAADSAGGRPARRTRRGRLPAAATGAAADASDDAASEAAE